MAPLHMSARLAAITSALAATVRPTTIRPIRASVLATVKMFCTHLPSSTPRQFRAVRNDHDPTATSWPAEMVNESR